MVRKYPRRLMLVLSILSDLIRGRAISVKTPNGLPVHVWPLRGLALPGFAGARPEEDDDSEDDDSEDDSDDEESAADDEDEDEEDDEDKVNPDDDWQTKSRKNERRAKRERKAREKLQAELDRERSRKKTAEEKALEKAREEGKTEAQKEADKERRADRLEVAVTRLAAKGVKVDDKKIRFRDAEDPHVNIERLIRKGEIDEDDIFDENGKVDQDALKDELAELAENKPHLVRKSDDEDGDEDEKPRRKRRGSSGAGKGGGGKDLSEMSAEEHLERIQKAKKPVGA